MSSKLLIPFDDFKSDRELIRSFRSQGREDYAKHLRNGLDRRMRRLKNMPLEVFLKKAEDLSWRVRHGWGRMTDKLDPNCEDEECEGGCRFEAESKFRRVNYRFVLSPRQVNVYSSDTRPNIDSYVITYIGQEVEELYPKIKMKLS